jgi:tetratricopeptide (TPR) repeat protein
MAVQRFRPRLLRPRARWRSGADPAYDRLVRLWLPIPPSGGSPTRRTLRALLAPDAGLTRWEGRDEERADLVRWCTDAGGEPVRVLAGASGVGKSRLAVELVRALPEEWAAGVARPGTAAQIVPVAAACRRSVLIVVDDADTEPAADIAALVDHAAGAPDRIRVLVVVRDAATVDAGECTTLRADAADDDRRRSFAAAVRGFSGLPADAALPPWADAERSPVGEDGEPIGITQTRAALAVLADDPDRAAAMRNACLDRLTEEVLAHEKQRWAAAASDPRWSLDDIAPEAQEDALLALLLHRPHRVEDAVDTLRTLGRFQDEPEDHVRDIAAWARHLYPGQVGGWWLDPRPDLLRSALLTVAPDRHRPQLVAALDRDPGVVLCLARAAAAHPRVVAVLRDLLAEVGLDAVVEAAVGAGPPGLILRAPLVEAVAACASSAIDLERLLPNVEAQAWSPVRVALRRAAVRHRRAAVDDPADNPAIGLAADAADGLADACADGADGRAALARALTDLGGTLRELGNHADALVPLREAVRICRGLGAEPELSAALIDLSASLRELGAHDEALATTREAVRRYRDLIAVDPDRYSGDLARALTDFGTDLRTACAPDEALTASREAVRRSRDLAAAGPARHVPDLAAALTGLGADLRYAGAHDEALAASREAVRLYRDVAANNADPHLPELARALTDLGVDLRTACAPDEALTAVREAVERLKELAAADPRHLPDLASARTVLGASLRETGEYRAGLAASYDAVRLCRELAAADPRRHTADLAHALTQLGISLWGAGPSEDGLTPGCEAVQIFRELAVDDPDRYTPDLARALTHLGFSLRGRAAHAEALIVTSEAVQWGRDLAVADPVRHIPDLTRALISLGAGLRALDRRPEAVAHEGEAVAWWWYLTEQRPGEFDDRYREAQRRFFHTFSPYDHDPNDLLTAELIARSRVLGYLDDQRSAEAPEDPFQAAAAG